jgi:REP element-mobilizing transposase RayT
MTSHIHAIVGAEGKERLQDIIRDIKKYTSRKIIRAIQNNLLKAGKNGC